MRLTLRTLLAYLDDILEPAQAKEIGEKIQESPFAASLVHKIKDVVRRRRIGAPEVTGPGSEPDPNVVAEYLDNSLPTDAVAEFERTCFQSDEQLAEVAATHQVLTLVLGESVDVPDELRAHMYSLGAIAPSPAEFEENRSVDHVPKVTGVGGVMADTHASLSAGQRKPATGLPERLRPRPAWKRFIPYVLGALVLAGWGYMMVTDYFTIHDDLAAENERVAQEVDLPSAPPEERAAPAGQAPFTDPRGAASAAASPFNNLALDEPLEVELAQDEDDFDWVPPAPSAPETSDANTPPPTPLPESLTENSTDASDSEATGDSLAARSAAGLDPEADAFDPPPKGDPPALEPFDIQYVNADGILLQFDPPADRWTVMPRRALIFTGEEVASPEPFNTRLIVSGDALVAEIALHGGTRVRLLQPTAESRLGLEIDRGRVQVIRRKTGAAADPLRLRLKIRGDEWLCELTEPNTVIGLEVIPIPPQGVGDMTGQFRYAGGSSLTSGAARLTAAGSPQGIELRPDTGSVEFSPDPNAAGMSLNASSSHPEWMTDNTASARLARQLAVKYEKEFLPDLPLSQSIRPAVKDRQPRISELATQTLALTDRLPGLVDALGAPHEESRIAAIEGLRGWLPRDEQHGPQLLSELQNRFREEEAAALFRMLWGYSPADARNQSTSAELIAWMSHDDVAVRELAAYHVHQLTGRNFGYRADRRPDEREAILRRWREHWDETGALLDE